MMVELLRGGVDPLPPYPYLDADVAQYLNMLLMMNEALAKAATEAHAKRWQQWRKRRQLQRRRPRRR